MIKTQWFMNSVPTRVGVYERDYGDLDGISEIYYCYFDGVNFHVSMKSVKDAETIHSPNNVSAYKNIPWRGVNND